MSLVSWKFIAGVGAGLKAGSKVLGNQAMKEEELKADKEAENRAFERAKILQDKQHQHQARERAADVKAKRRERAADVKAKRIDAKTAFKQQGGFEVLSRTLLAAEMEEQLKRVSAWQKEYDKADKGGAGSVKLAEIQATIDIAMLRVESLSKDIAKLGPINFTEGRKVFGGTPTPDPFDGGEEGTGEVVPVGTTEGKKDKDDLAKKPGNEFEGAFPKQLTLSPWYRSDEFYKGIQNYTPGEEETDGRSYAQKRLEAVENFQDDNERNEFLANQYYPFWNEGRDGGDALILNPKYKQGGQQEFIHPRRSPLPLIRGDE